MSDISDDDDCQIDVKLQEKFNKAADFIQNIQTKISSADLLILYAFYKQATRGKCNTTKPTSIFNIQDKSKWKAWNSLGDMEMSKAMENYIEKVLEFGLDISEFNNQHNTKAQQWVCQSILSENIETELKEHEKTIFDYVKELNFNKFKLNLNKEEINVTDTNGLGLIHWATDRNASEILEFLLESGANINLQDDEKQTALHYASSCGHAECIKILLKYKPDKSLQDSDGQTCLQVAFDDSIKMLLN